jgi:hypothetical protein
MIQWKQLCMDEQQNKMSANIKKIYNLFKT